ncbi:MAG: VOC family protein [Candidatus Acidiferrales bacterium]
MITGTHALLYSDHAEEVRAFFRNVLKFPSVDAGHGWLIFALPPAELGIHPAEKGTHAELYLMCDDVKSTVADLGARGVKFSRPITEAGFGLMTSIALPGGSELGLYQPKHPLAPAWPAATSTQKPPIARRSKSRKKNSGAKRPKRRHGP